jgi:MerR family copper efflux transcriptional regulator
MGFALEEIQALLDLRVDDPAACPVVEAKTREKIAQVERKLRELTRMRDVLEGLADSCRSHLRTDECPILEALSEEHAST